MNRKELIRYILQYDNRFSLKELSNHSYTELVMIKVSVELQKERSQKGGGSQ